MTKKITPTHPALFERRYLTLIIVLIFISAAIAFYICYRHHTINTEQTLQKDRSTAEIISLLMEEHLKKIVSAMESYANRPLLLRAAKDKNVKKANVHLVSLTKHYPDINSLIITDRQGTLWTAYPERPELLGKSFAYRDWYKEISKEWKANISDVVLLVVGEKDSAFQISVPIFDETGQVIGILLSTQRTVGLSSLIKHLPLDPGTFITITDRKGQIACSSRHNVEKEIRSYPFHSNIKKAMAANNKTFAVDDPIFVGRTHYISFAPVGNIGWTVLIERDKRSILLSEYAYFVQVTAIVFLLCLLIILFIVYSNKRAQIVSEFSESVINTVREPLIALDKDLRVVKVNRSFYDFFKVKPEDTVGQLIYDLGNKQWDIPKLRELLETILPQKSIFNNYEVEHEFATIGRRVMLLNARQIERVLGKEQIILLAIEDITERKQIEAGLEKTRKDLAVVKKSADEASEFAENLINTVREPLIALDQNLRVVKVSNSFYEFFKVKPEDTMGQLIYDLGNKQWDIPKLRELLENILPQKVSFDNYEVEHEFATIGRRVMLLNARQIERVLGKEQIILLAIEDITERKQIESIGRLATVVRDSNDAITIQDIKGNILAWNRGAELMFGYNEQEALQMTIWQLTPPDKAAEQKDFNRRIFTGENVSSFETQRLTKDGRLLDMWLTVTKLVDNAGKVIGIASTERDITERKEMEKELKKRRDYLEQQVAERTADLKQQAVALEASNHELESFAYSVSHDLRAPLRGIEGWSLALLEDYKDKLDEQGHQYIDRMRSETQIMGRLIDDLLIFSRQSRAEMNQRPLDMTAMAQAIIFRLQQQNLTLQTDFIVQPGLRALGDFGLIEIALKNLLDNAMKFSSKSSRAVIEFGQVEQEGQKAFFVRDNGVGFDMAYSNKLFGVFQRLHKASEFPGTGIGLASVQRIINRHGGRIWAEAKVNEGATFYFTLKEAI